MKTLEDVKKFWESNPLWTGESHYETGTLDFFEEHKNVYINDVFAGRFPVEVLPGNSHRENVLDLGCGIGFWTVELAERGCNKVIAADLTENALNLAKARCQEYKLNNVEFSVQNAEAMSFNDGEFDHVNCQGVIHHTPNTEKCVSEIARVLNKGGTASISVYYKNWFLRNWNMLSWVGGLLSKKGAKLSGRGREDIYSKKDIDEIVRLYDGTENPIGKAYSRSEFENILRPYFEINSIHLHFFPARTLPIPLPNIFHRFLDKYFGFMVFAELKKK